MKKDCKRTLKMIQFHMQKQKILYGNVSTRTNYSYIQMQFNHQQQQHITKESRERQVL